MKDTTFFTSNGGYVKMSCLKSILGSALVLGFTPGVGIVHYANPEDMFKSENPTSEQYTFDNPSKVLEALKSNKVYPPEVRRAMIHHVVWATNEKEFDELKMKDVPMSDEERRYTQLEMLSRVQLDVIRKQIADCPPEANPAVAEQIQADIDQLQEAGKLNGLTALSAVVNNWGWVMDRMAQESNNPLTRLNKARPTAAWLGKVVGNASHALPFPTDSDTDPGARLLPDVASFWMINAAAFPEREGLGESNGVEAYVRILQMAAEKAETMNSEENYYNRSSHQYRLALLVNQARSMAPKIVDAYTHKGEGNVE
jgi:hypothetical protein